MVVWQLALLLLVAVGLCGSNHSACQIFDSSGKSFQQYCENFNGTLPGNCSSNVDSLNDPSQINQLTIGGCDTALVSRLAKRFQKNLRALDISFSGYKNLESFDIRFDQLQIFNASHNELSRISWNFFVEFPEIVEIDLSYNYLINAHIGLMKLPKLRKLHLSHNHDLYENNLTPYVNMRDFPLETIEYLDLRSNHIEIFNGVPYEHYISLKEFHLEDNPIRKVDSDLLEGMFHGRLTSLFLSWNSINNFFGHCSDDCRTKRMRIVRINGTGEGIFITSNGTFEMRCRDKCFKNVIFFHAGRNKFQNGNDAIQNIGSNIYFLNLSGNFIGKLNASVFDRFTILRSLELSETNLTWFDFDVLRNQRYIYELDISNNNLKELHNIPLLRNYNLQELIMGGNQIENTYEITEYLDPSIKKLDFSGGKFVGKVNETTFRRLTELKQLNLSNTNLVLPNSNPFEMLQNLQVLDLSQNNLENFNFSILSATLYNLKELYLADCKIKDISAAETVIQYLGPHLTKLDLSKNAAYGRIDSLHFDSKLLQSSRELTFLDISNNNLKTVDFKSFPFEFIDINLEGNDLIELTNLQGRHTKWHYATLALANNRFPCLYLKELNEDYEEKELDLIGDSWHQKDGRDCRTTTQSISDFLTNVYDTIKFW